MTVTYSLDVSSSSFFCLYKLLFKWKGSVWKSVWTELLAWCSIYAVISFMYRMILSSQQKYYFESLCVFFYAYSDYIPITFMLGFYVSTVFTRWWDVFVNIGWVDSPMLLVSCLIRGADEHARIIRRNIMRYLVLTQALVLRDISASVKKRFPTLLHLVTAGLMTEKELEVFNQIESPHVKYWVPMHWAFCLCRVSREDGLINSDILLMDLLEKLRQFRVNVMNLTLYDWVPVPLVYTQVVHIAIRTYFFLALFGRQYIDLTNHDTSMPRTVDIYVPIMTILQFICFVGWMKVAEVLLNPLGEDDDDFECNWILDRNLQVAFSVVDDAYGKFPPDAKDPWWETSHPEPLYTAESAVRQANPLIGSCKNMPTEDRDYMVRRPNSGVEIQEEDIIPITSSKLGPFGRLRRHSGAFANMMKRKQEKNDANRSPESASVCSTPTPRKKRSMSSMFPSEAMTVIGKLPLSLSRTSSICSSAYPDDRGDSCFSMYQNAHSFSPFEAMADERPKVLHRCPQSSYLQSQSTWQLDENQLPVITEEEIRRRGSKLSGDDTKTASQKSIILDATQLEAEFWQNYYSLSESFNNAQ